MTSLSNVVDLDRSERVAVIRSKIAAFKETLEARFMWQDWAVERFRLATAWEIDHLGQFATFSLGEGVEGFRCRGMTPAGWAKLIEFTNLARKEKRQIPALRGQEDNRTENKEDNLTSSVLLGIMKASSERVA
jgi:hypothetical protein